MQSFQSSAPPDYQFGLPALLGYVTCCAVLLGLSPLVGTPASVFLMLLTLALWSRRGGLTLLVLMAVVVSAEWNASSAGRNSGMQTFLALSIAALLCGGFACSRVCRRRTSVDH